MLLYELTTQRMLPDGLTMWRLLLYGLTMWLVLLNEVEVNGNDVTVKKNFYANVIPWTNNGENVTA